MERNLNTGVKELRRALGLSQQIFATQLGLSIRAVVNYEKDRAPTARALAQLAKLASVNEQPELARVFRDALGSELGLGMSDRPPLSAEELYLDRAFRRCVFENPRSPAALKIRRALQDYVEQIKKEDEHSSRILDKQRNAR
jgi:transcriptional regulator with XRE-family HTH domain